MTTQKGKSFKDTNTDISLEEIPEPFRNALNEIIDKKISTEPLKRRAKVIQKPLPQILDEMDENIRAVAEAARKAEEAARAAKQSAIEGIKASTEAGKRAEEARLAGQIAAEKASKAAAEAATKAEAIAKLARIAAQEAGTKAGEADKATKAAIKAFRQAAQESALKAIRETAEAKKIVRRLKKHEASLVYRIDSLEKRFSNIEASLPSEKVIILRKVSKEQAKKEIRKLFSESNTLYYSDIAERLGLDLELVVDICNELQRQGKIKVDDKTLQSG